MNIGYARMHVDARDRELLHLKEAARELGCHPATLRRHIADGELQAVRLGRRGGYRISREALERFLRPAGGPRG